MILILDIKLIREEPHIIEKDLKKRQDEEKLKMLYELIEKDKERRELIQKLEEMKHHKNNITQEISVSKSKGQSIEHKLEEMRHLTEKITQMDVKYNTRNEECQNILMRLPNILHESVPVGKDDTENQTIRTYGEQKPILFRKDHIEIGKGMIEIEKASKISGARFYFLKDKLALLEKALMNFAIDFMVSRKFTYCIPPFMMKREAYQGVTDLADFENVLYKIENEDLYMIATSEHPLTAQYMNEILEEKDLPLKMVGFSTNFRKEAGSHGKDTKGIFRVHQFNKVEQIVICRPGESWIIHEELIKNAEDFFKMLEIPYRIVNICTGDIGTVAAKKYDLEAWMPAQQKYREMVSCSNCTDYQARRLNIKYKEIEGKASKGFVHTLNSTVVTDRALVAIIENNQQEDGSILVPNVLRKYTEFDVIKP